MAATLKKPSREKEEAGAGNIMLDVHPLHPSRPFPNRKPNRENRIKNACNSISHSNIAPSNDKRPLFVHIPATPSASLVSTSLPVQCLRPTNFFFFRGIFADNFLPNLSQPRSERIATTFRTYRDHVRNVSRPRSGRIKTTFRTYRNHVPNLSRPRSGRIATTFRTYQDHVPDVSQPRSEPIETTFGTYRNHVPDVS